MHARITRTFLAAAAAGATVATMGLAAAGSAAAATTAHRVNQPFSGGPPVYTAPCSNSIGFSSNAPTTFPFGLGGCAGYAGSNRTFRYAQSIIRIPQTNVIPLTGTVGGNANGNAYQAPTLYVGLSSSDSMASAGLMTCANFVAVFFGADTNPPVGNPCRAVSGAGTALNPFIYPNIWVGVGWTAANNGASVLSSVVNLTGVSPGDGVKFQIYYPEGGAAHFTITPPVGSATSFQLPSSGTFNAVFDHAEAVVAYSASRTCLTDTNGTPNIDCNSPAGGGHTADFSGFPMLAPGAAPSTVDLRITQFQAGGWTTNAGVRGTFSGAGGKWTLTPGVLTSNGVAPPGGTVQVEPAYLWNDGLGSGAGDAFGVWWRH
ncbi:MAG TPA: hypothetical protein VIX86_25905 [Streptosporangiaceae bacterium]